MIKITFGNNIPGYEYGPSDAPGVVVLQEWWGHTKLHKQAITLSEKGGYRVLIPDLYKGKVGVDAEEAHHPADDLDWPTARNEAAAQNGKKVGVVGFCQGGSLTLIAAQQSRAASAAPFYGVPKASAEAVGFEAEKIKIPVLMQFGRKDTFFPPDEAQAVHDKIKGAGGDVELRIYEKVGHAFLNGFTAQAVERMEELKCPRLDKLQEVQEEAWSRLLAFFEKHLKA